MTAYDFAELVTRSLHAQIKETFERAVKETLSSRLRKALQQERGIIDVEYKEVDE